MFATPHRIALRSMLGAAALGLGSLAVPALAHDADAGEFRQLAVPFHLEDLASAKGQAHLRARLARAAFWVCGAEPGAASVNDSSAEQRACITNARRHAEAQLAARLDDRKLASRN